MPTQSNEKANGAKARHARKGIFFLIALTLTAGGYVGTAPQAEAATPLGTKIVTLAKKEVGADYVYGAQKPRTSKSRGAFDCSGLVQYVYKKNGVTLPRSSSGIRSSSKLKKVRTTSAGKVKKYAKPGDVLYTPGHVAIYVGSGKMIDAGNPRVDVSKRKIYSGSWTILRSKKAAPAVKKKPAGKYVHLTGNEYARTGPSKSHKHVGIAHKGMTYRYVASRNGWYEVVYHGHHRWISGKYAHRTA